MVDLAVAEIQTMTRPKNAKAPAEVFDRIRGIVLRVIQPDTTPPSPLLKSLQDSQVPSGMLSVLELRTHLLAYTATSLRVPVGFRSPYHFKSAV